ncbi:TadE family protein [Sphingomonas sp.]|uniref:TadE/TadG family type IV pilus assembly protein n=1 Tax=Sphingomonas sp. TaxID=28214 RepID=UPI00182B585E|nr:TadE family protein [Sphingomonas sp.]MBA3511418.1 pilus assembly protein [Sphingomonas sp.]
MIRFVRSLARDERGASIIEMAMVTPVLATLLVGMVDISRAYSAKLQLEQAAQRSIEKVQQYRTTTSTYSTLRAEAATAAGVNATDVTVDYWLECNGVRSSNYETNCASGQNYARYISVSINKKFSPMFGTRFFPGANADGTYTINAEAGLRTQ